MVRRQDQRMLVVPRLGVGSGTKPMSVLLVGLFVGVNNRWLRWGRGSTSWW
jgi:hypothetical protein